MGALTEWPRRQPGSAGGGKHAHADARAESEAPSVSDIPGHHNAWAGTRGWHLAALFLLLALMTEATGCIRQGRGYGELHFSPDGQRICYVREDRIEEAVVDGDILLRSISLHWCGTGDPAKESSVHIGRLGWTFRGYGGLAYEAKWSGDGSWIGVYTPYRLTVVDANSGKKQEIRDGTITSFAWQPDNVLAYHTVWTVGDRDTRAVVRMDPKTGKRTDVFAFPTHAKQGSIGSGYWSPSGRFFIVMEPAAGGRFYCVDAASGSARAFGQGEACDAGVAWTPDSSRAFCVSRKIGPEDRYEAILFEPATGAAADCSASFQSTFAGHMPALEPVWTADGKYVLVNALDIGGHLVQPDPWRAIPLGRLLAPEFPLAAARSTTNPWLFRLPVTGWVGIIPTGNYGDSPVLYAADYSGQRVVPLLQGRPRIVSPDGTMEATMGQDGRISIRNLGNWRRQDR